MLIICFWRSQIYKLYKFKTPSKYVKVEVRHTSTADITTELLKEAEANPIKIGETIIENSRTEKNLGDQIHEDGTAASIHETLSNIIPIAYERGEDILYICYQPSLIGFNIASGPVEKY